MQLFFNNKHRKLFVTLQRFYSSIKLKPPWNILFFGTDKFSLESLTILHDEKKTSNKIINNLEVVTTSKNSYVKKYAEDNGINIQHWPLQLPLKPYKPFHIGVVVSFGQLIPKDVIESFPMGMINVHASLLPRWRGAAPIIHAIAAGDATTGITIMKIRPHRFDVGEIIHQERITIAPDIRMPQLHDLLAKVGAKNLLEVLSRSPGILNQAIQQDLQSVTLAQRVNMAMANINFDIHTAKDIYNLNRALTGLYPLSMYCEGKTVKIHNVVSYQQENMQISKPGHVIYNKAKKMLQITTKDGWIFVDKIGVPGKKVMNATEFSNGYLKNGKTVIFNAAISS